MQVLIHHIPGGMISNTRSQLAQQGALDKLPEVLEELPRVRKDMGYPPLVTPTSQIMGVQAVLNVLSGKRYEMVSNETRQYVAGYYGRSPAPVDPKLEKKILGKEKKITCRPADLLEPGLAKAAKELDPKLVQSEEDILSYCMFPAVALDYFQWRAKPEGERDPIPADGELTVAKAAEQAKQAKEAPKPAPLSADDAKFAVIGKQFVALFGSLGGNLKVDASALAAAPAETAEAAAPEAAPAPAAAPKKTLNATLTGRHLLPRRRARQGQPGGGRRRRQGRPAGLRARGHEALQPRQGGGGLQDRPLPGQARRDRPKGRAAGRDRVSRAGGRPLRAAPHFAHRRTGRAHVTEEEG